MAGISGALLSLGASGTIAKTITFSKWKGVPYARQRVIPANPQSVAQTLTRDIFRNLNSIWKIMPALAVSPWTRFASGQALTDRNAMMGQNIAILRPEADLAKFIFSPGAKGGLAPTTVVITPVSQGFTVDITEPAIPTGWTITRAVAAAIVDGAPATITDFSTVAAEDLSTPFTVALAGLQGTTLYTIGAWLEWAKPDGSVAYGASLVSTDTTLA